MEVNNSFPAHKPIDLTYDKLLQVFYSKSYNFSSLNETTAASINESIQLKFNELLDLFNPDNYPDLKREILIRNAFIIFFYALIIAVSLFGNLLVCYVILSTTKRTAKRLNTTNLVIVNLTISDLIMTIFSIPVTIARLLSDDWRFGSLLCKLVPLIQVTSVYMSTFSMACIAIDRYCVLVRSPTTQQYSSTALPKTLLITLMWSIAILLSVPHAVFNNTVKLFSYKTITRCQTIYPKPEQTYRQTVTLITFLTQYLIPLSLTLILYAIIGRKIYRRVCIGECTEKQLTNHTQSKRRTLLMLAVVVVVFAICWLPLHLYHILRDFRVFEFSLKTFYCVHWFAMSSVCYNPFIYFSLNKYYRNAVRSMCLCGDIGNHVSQKIKTRSKVWSRGSNRSSYRSTLL